jgi:hypothetical protein
MSLPPSEPAVYNLHLVLSLFAQESRAPFPMRRQVLMGIVQRFDPEAPLLVEEVRQIQLRLGTPDERPEDLERAKVVAHRLSTLMCLAVLAQGVQERQGSKEPGTDASGPLPAENDPPGAPA